MKKTLLFATVTVVAFFVITELILRAVLPLPTEKSLEWPPPDMTKHGLKEDDARFWALRPGYDARWKLVKLAYTHELAKDEAIDWERRKRQAVPAYRGVTWQVNKQGFRGDPVPVPKPEGIRRLLFIGSSITFGWGVPAEDAFPVVIKDLLDRNFSGRSFDCVNAGVPGYSSYQGRVYLRRLLPEYEPDIVVAEFGINDGTLATARQDKDWHPSLTGTIRKWLRTTGWRRLIVRLFGLDGEAETLEMKPQDYETAAQNFYRVSLTGEETRVSPSDFKENLEAMAEMCRRRGAVFGYFVPSLFNEFGKERLIPAVDLATENAIPVHQALSAYSRAELKTLFLPYDEGHFSAKGHQVVAQSIVDYLKPRMNRGD
jgi:lysophospholipase L1-like esterase